MRISFACANHVADKARLATFKYLCKTHILVHTQISMYVYIADIYRVCPVCCCQPLPSLCLAFALANAKWKVFYKILRYNARYFT